MPSRDLSYFKPARFTRHMTLAEVAEHVGRDPSRIRALEKEGRLPRAARVKAGELRIRLWSPEQVNEIQTIFDGMRPGRPRNG